MTTRYPITVDAGNENEQNIAVPNGEQLFFSHFVLFCIKMVRFNDVKVNDPNCYKSDKLGQYPPFFLGKAKDFKSDRFPFLDEFGDATLTIVHNCDSASIDLAIDKASKRVHDINILIYRHENHVTSPLTEADLDSLLTEQHLLRRMINEYYKPLFLESIKKTKWGGSRRKRQSKRRKRQSRRSRF